MIIISDVKKQIKENLLTLVTETKEHSLEVFEANYVDGYVEDLYANIDYFFEGVRKCNVDMRDAAEDQISDLEDEIENLKSEVDDLEGVVEVLEIKLDELQDEIYQLRSSN